jgi:hypothetical protein
MATAFGKNGAKNLESLRGLPPGALAILEWGDVNPAYIRYEILPGGKALFDNSGVPEIEGLESTAKFIAHVFKKGAARVRVDLSKALLEEGGEDPDIAANCLRLASLTVSQIRAVLDRLGETAPRCSLLAKGTDSLVFNLSSGRVLKITRSKTDAELLAATSARSSPYVAKAHDVFSITVEGRSRYAIVMDHLKPLSPGWSKFFSYFSNAHIALQGDPPKMLKAFQKSYPRTSVTDEQRDWIIGAFSYLSGLGITFHDFHSGNMMMRGSTPQIVDLGDSDGPGFNIDKLDEGVGRSLRSSLIRMAHTQPELRPHLLPLLKKGASDDLDDELSPEENAVLLWERKYRTRQEALLRVWESEYDRRLESLGDDLLSDLESLKKLVRFWFWERKGNYLETPVEEAPDFEGARGAMFHRRRKALADVKAVADRMAARLSSVGLFGDDFLNGLYRELDQYERSFDSL